MTYKSLAIWSRLLALAPVSSPFTTPSQRHNELVVSSGARRLRLPPDDQLRMRVLPLSEMAVVSWRLFSFFISGKALAIPIPNFGV